MCDSILTFLLCSVISVHFMVIFIGVQVVLCLSITALQTIPKLYHLRQLGLEHHFQDGIFSHMPCASMFLGLSLHMVFYPLDLLNMA